MRQAPAPIGRWGLAEIERLFALWHGFRAGEFARPVLRRRLVPLQARLGRLLRRGQANPDRKAAGLCRELTKWWAALWTFARVEGAEPTNNVAERAVRPAPTLAVTGEDSQLRALVGMVALLGGLGLVLMRRRNRRTA